MVSAHPAFVPKPTVCESGYNGNDNDMDVNYKLELTAKEFGQIRSIAESMGVEYRGVGGGNSNPCHGFFHPKHRSPWIFVIDSAWKKYRHVRFQKFYSAATDVSAPVDWVLGNCPVGRLAIGIATDICR